MKTKILLVYPHDIVGKFIDVFQGYGEDFAHAAIVMADDNGKPWVWEAIRGGFRKTEVALYADKKYMEYSIDIPDLPSALCKANELLGNDYGYLSCVEGAVYDFTGITVSQGGEESTNCSESVVIIVRSGNGELCGDVPASCVTPEKLQEYFDSNGIVGVRR